MTQTDEKGKQNYSYHKVEIQYKLTDLHVKTLTNKTS